MKYQFMPMFWGDFFANTLHLSAQELGAYVALIGHAWEHDGNIAVADLQRVARVSNWHWTKIQVRLEPFFNTLKVRNNWHHERVHSERTKAAEISNKRKEAALQMHSKSKASAYASHHASTTTATKERGKTPQKGFSPVQEQPLPLPLEKKGKENIPARSLAALPTGALTREPNSEPAERKWSTDKKAEELTLAEINALWRLHGGRT